MKKLHPLLSVLLVIISCSKPIDDDSLVERNGIHYQVNSETPYSGKSFSLHDNGQKYYERSFKNGKQEGLFTSWWKNGQKRFEVTYKDGETISEKVEWKEDGSLKIPVDFKTLIEKDGLYYDVNSEKPYSGKVFYLHENGKKGGEGNFIGGKRNGLFLDWYENGQKESEVTYKDGKEDGLWTIWYENGQKSGESTLKDGKVVSYKEWNEDGSVMEIIK